MVVVRRADEKSMKDRYGKEEIAGVRRRNTAERITTTSPPVPSIPPFVCHPYRVSSFLLRCLFVYVSAARLGSRLQCLLRACCVT